MGKHTSCGAACTQEQVRRTNVYGTSCDFISEKHRGRGGKPGISFNYGQSDTRQKWQCAIDSAAVSRRSWNLKKLKVELVLSFSPPSAPRPHLYHPPAIYPLSSTNSMLHTDELEVMEQAQIKRNASKCNTAVDYFRK